MTNNCQVCGTKLMRTGWGNWYCPNCGKIPENQNLSSDEGKSDDKGVSYIG